jgi:prepilin-type N-terminal cleavage/methylation domain-containing protein
MGEKTKSQKGFGMVEMLVSVAILAVIGVAFLSALTLSSSLLLKTEVEEKSKDLAASTIERVINADWNTDYSNLNSTDGNFSVTVSPPAALNDGNLQKITVVVTHATKEISSLSAYKVKP